MVRADEISTKELVVTAAESVAGFLGFEQRETAMFGVNFIQGNAYTTKVSGIVVEEEIVLPRRGLSWVGFEIWFILYWQIRARAILVYTFRQYSDVDGDPSRSDQTLPNSIDIFWR